MVAITIPPVLAGWNLSTFETSVTQSASTVRGWARLNISDSNSNQPILVLLHGYPQTNYMWRHAIKLLPRDSRLFIPDIPGYGNSSPSQTHHDKSTIGQAILSSLSSLLISSSSSSSTSSSFSPPQIILIGHDRGARICHRLAVDAASYSSQFTLLGTILMDIVPTSTMWSGAAHDPREAAGFFHWPFLANVELATEMILAMGPEHFAQRLIQRWRGDSSTAIASLESDDAMEMYKRPFRQLESVVRATCLDYQAGASVDVDAQREDQKAGRKIEVPTLVLYSRGLGKRYNVPNEWEGWVAQKQLLKTFELGPGVGHFVAEEDPEGTVRAVESWMKDVNIY